MTENIDYKCIFVNGTFGEWHICNENDKLIATLLRHEKDGDRARFIVTACNCHAKLLEALKEIAKGEGAYSRDPLTHATNTIANMQSIARKAIRPIEEQA